MDTIREAAESTIGEGANIRASSTVQIQMRTRYCRTEFPTDVAGHPRQPPDGPTVPSTSVPSSNAIGRATSHCNDLTSNDVVLIYVDAAFSAQRCTYAFVIIDNQGTYLHARAGRMLASSSLHAELLAIMEAITYLNRCCFTKMQIFTDSMLAVTYLHADSTIWPWNIAFLLQRCISAWCINTYPIAHTPRSLNLLAHTLAQSVDQSSSIIDYDEIPDSLLDFFT